MVHPASVFRAAFLTRLTILKRRFQVPESMTIYTFNAVDAVGQRSEGTMEGASRRFIVRQLLKKSLHPTRVEEAVVAKPGTKAIGSSAVAALYGRLGELLDAGVPLAQALKLVADITSNESLQHVLRTLHRDINDGIDLPTAAARHPGVFSPMAVAVLRASMAGGFTAAALKQLETSMRKTIEMRNQLIGAMLYPTFLLVSGAVMLLALFLFFIPRFEPMFASLKEADELPVITTLMMSTNAFIETHLMSLVTGLVVSLFVVVTMLSRPACRLAVLRFLMRIPKLGEFIAVVSLSRFSQLISTLLKNGVMLDKALQLCINATGNILLRELVRDAADRVSEGETLSSRFRNVPWVPREFGELLVVGEQTNRLSETLGDVSALYERRVSGIVKSALTLVEPVLLVCIGLMVSAMVFAVVLPILRASSLV